MLEINHCSFCGKHRDEVRTLIESAATRAAACETCSWYLYQDSLEDLADWASANIDADEAQRGLR